MHALFIFFITPAVSVYRLVIVVALVYRLEPVCKGADTAAAARLDSHGSADRSLLGRRRRRPLIGSLLVVSSAYLHILRVLFALWHIAVIRKPRELNTVVLVWFLVRAYVPVDT